MRIRAFFSSSSFNSTSSAPAVLSTPSPPSNASNSSCQGLDLLLLAATEVIGNRAMEIESSEADGALKLEEKSEGEADEVIVKPKRQRRQMAMPSRFQDSVMQPWKRRTRRRLAGNGRSG